jgi:hypothetical protein
MRAMLWPHDEGGETLPGRSMRTTLKPFVRYGHFRDIPPIDSP